MVEFRHQECIRCQVVAIFASEVRRGLLVVAQLCATSSPQLFVFSVNLILQPHLSQWLSVWCGGEERGAAWMNLVESFILLARSIIQVPNPTPHFFSLPSKARCG